MAARGRAAGGGDGRDGGAMSMTPVDVRDEAVEVWDGRLRLHVKVAGDGPPLLYFHPLSGLAPARTRAATSGAPSPRRPRSAATAAVPRR